MAKKEIDNITELIRITGLSRNAINKLWRNQDIETVNKIGDFDLDMQCAKN